MMGSDLSEGMKKRGGAGGKDPPAPPLRSITERAAALLQGPGPPLSQGRRSAYPLPSAAGSVDPAFLHGSQRAEGQVIKGLRGQENSVRLQKVPQVAPLQVLHFAS